MAHFKKKYVKKPVQRIEPPYGDAEKFAIYPDNGWDTKKWGPKPLLGFVKADDEFWAKYAAYDKRIARPNATFGYVAVKVVPPPVVVEAGK